MIIVYYVSSLLKAKYFDKIRKATSVSSPENLSEMLNRLDQFSRNNHFDASSDTNNNFLIQY